MESWTSVYLFVYNCRSYLTLISLLQPFETGEDVLVESKSGKLLWDATVNEVSRARENGPVTGYRVRYKGWGDRYDEWVSSDRLVEPSENNRQVQASQKLD